MVSISQPAKTSFPLNRALQAVVIALALAGFVSLAAVASGQAYTDVDMRITQLVQGLTVPGLDPASGVINFLTDAPMAIGLWAVAITLFALKGRPVEAIAIFLIFGLWLGNEFVGTIVDRPSPSQGIGGLVEFSRAESGSFPSGHVTGAVVFYGLLTFLTFSNMRRGVLRVLVPALAVTIVGLASLSRVYVGAHWPSDILGSYIIGIIGIVGIAWVYTNIKYDTLRIPRPRKKQSDRAVDGVKIASSIASKVYLDPRAGTATKEYFPPMPVKALYWLAYQAPFPYQGRRVSLEAAEAKRKVAGLLTKHRFGYDMVAAVHGIEDGDKGYRFVTEYIPGVEPESNSEVEELLSEMYAFFEEVGLPTWQIAPGNPHAYSNFIRKPDGQIKLIDLESALISTTSSFKQLRSAMRDGLFPVFDDVDFVQMHSYVDSHASDLEKTLGPRGFEELERAVESAQVASRSWRDSEPRVWGRAAAWIHRRLDMSGIISPIRRCLGGAEAKATAFLNAAVDRWEREGRIDGARAGSLRDAIETPEMKQLVGHMGSHLVLSVAIVVPIPGLRSVARFGWTAAFRLKARYNLARGRITREDYRVARSLHSVPVMLIALIPGFGAIAYVASGTMVKTGLGRILIDQSAYKLPFGLYRKLGLARFTLTRSQKAAGERTAPSMPDSAQAASVRGQNGGPFRVQPRTARASLTAVPGLDVFRQRGALKPLAAHCSLGERGPVAVPLEPAA